MLSFLQRAAGRFRHRREFDTLCRQFGLDLSYEANRDSLSVLREVFVARRYADGFPFYQPATLLDVGAHKGYFSIFAARHAGPGARIVALEPHPDTASVLHENLRRNGAAQVKVEQVALSARSVSADLHLDRSWNHSLVPQADGPTVRVSTATLAGLMDQHGLDRVDLLKMDCEGAEYDVLLSADRALLERIGVVSLEFHDLRDARFTGQRLARHLSDNGFHILRFAHAPTTRDLNYGHLVALQNW